jgi:hypothetical protein
MNYQAFTNDSLTMMYQGVRGALAADDALSELGEEPRFRVRETPDWKLHASDLEAELLRRGKTFDVIDWSEGKSAFRAMVVSRPRVPPLLWSERRPQEPPQPLSVACPSTAA